MTQDTREYLQEAVAVIQRRQLHRSGHHLKLWEQKLLDGAQRILHANQSDLPLGGGHDYTSPVPGGAL